jgi:hypothetical protein
MIGRIAAIALLAVGLTSCATTGHQFANPATDWQARNGQLLYHGRKTTLMGEVLVRFSSKGDFELTFTKGPGVTLLMVRQDPTFVRVSGPLARGSWSGPPAQAPTHVRGWVELRDVLMKARDQQTVRHSSAGESFSFHF